MKKIIFAALLVFSLNGLSSLANAEETRPCSVYPASVTPECVAENLAYEAQRQAAYQEQQKAAQEAAKKAEEENTQRQYVENGSRPCSLYPASVTPECVAENLAYEAQRQAAYQEQQKAAQEAAKKAEEENRKVTDELTSKLKSITTQNSKAKVLLPVSNKIVEKYQVTTPKICKVVGNTVVRIKNGTCELKASFTTDQNVKVNTTKKIIFKK